MEVLSKFTLIKTLAMKSKKKVKKNDRFHKTRKLQFLNCYYYNK